ncbi:MAG: MaoC family dehydratase N-terminal domain-containing protein [Propionicimonas sp.]
MPISEAHVGRSYPPTEPYQVSRAKIAEFAAALGDGANPAYAGPDPIAPPTFAVLLSSAAWGALFEDAELELALSRTVHADQRFTWSRPLHAGDEVAAQLTIEQVRVRGPVTFVTIAVRLTTTEGEDVCTATSTLMHRAVAA